MVKTTNGTVERGPATQRHFVRAVDNDLDPEDSHVVCAFDSGRAAVAIGSMDDARRVLELAAKWGGKAELGLSDVKSWQYNHSGQISVDVSFE